MMRAQEKERGVALLATMMAVALMTVLVVDFTYSATSGYRSAANQINGLRADYLARSGVQVGLGLLAQDARKDTLTQEPYDGLDESWAMPFPPLPVDGGTATVSIVDESRKLNINQLVSPINGVVNVPFLQTLTRLFALIEVPPEVIPAIIDWLDRDSVPSPGGAEADFYVGLMPPYEPRNGPMPTIADLKMIRGIDDAMFMRLKRYLTVAPEVRVNINTAPPEVLMALVPQLANEPSLVDQMMKGRPFRSLLDLKEIPGLETIFSTLPSLLTTQSDYFTITGVGTYAGARTLVHASVRRNGIGPVLLASWQED